MVSWSAAQFLKQTGAGGHRVYSSAPSMQSIAGEEGGSHKILGSAAQVPAGSLVLGGSHRVCSLGSSMHFGADGFSWSQGLQLISQQAV